mgnify:FL=1
MCSEKIQIRNCFIFKIINMKQLQYLFFKLLSKVFHNNEIKHNFLRRQGIQIGGGGNIVANICTAESFLIHYWK